MNADVLRNLTLLVPTAAVVAVVIIGRRRRLTPAFLAGLWVFTGVMAVESATDWWRFTHGPTSYLGIPIEAAIGWALLWGALPALVGGPLWVWLVAFAWTDVIVMPRLEPLLVLGDSWLLGELLTLAAVATPALLLGRATRDRRYLGLRTSLQVILFASVTFWLIPTVTFGADGTAWADVTDHPYPVRGLLLTAVVVCLVPPAAAVAELARVGGGTPFPWDPPGKLVVTGPYAYVANPMQMGTTTALLLLAAAAGSLMLAGVAISAVAFSLAVAEPHERTVLGARWVEFTRYRSHVRSWVPRWRPWTPEPATLWVSESCGICRAVGGSLERTRPVGLSFHSAENASVRLTRMRWSRSATPADRGVAALGRALEHVNLVAAWAGWLIRLPVVHTVLQMTADACGLGPRDLSRTTAR